MQAATIGHNNPPADADLLAERLATEYDLERSMTDSLTSRTLPETVEDEKQAGVIADYVKAVVSHRTSLQDIHKREKAPFWKACGIADEWLRDQVRSLEGAQAKAMQLAQVFIDRKAAEERKRLADLAKLQHEKARAIEVQAQVHADAGIADTAQELQQHADNMHAKAEMIRDHATTAPTNRLATARGVTGSISSTDKWVGEVEDRAIVEVNKLLPYISEKDLQRYIDAFVKAGGRDLAGVKIHQVSQAKFSSKR